MSQAEELHATILADPRRIQVLFAGHQVADSREALVVREPGQPPVWYFPRADVEMLVLSRNGKQTFSASKGPASYFTIYREGHVVENAVWSYDDPPSAFQSIASRIAFNPVHFEFEAAGHAPAEWDPDGNRLLPAEVRTQVRDQFD